MRSKIFSPQAIDEVLQEIRSKFTDINDLTCFAALERGSELTLDEKKSAGLNSRRKYFDYFISLVDLEILAGRCPNVAYMNAYMDAWRRTMRASALERMKRSVISHVEILDVGGCSAIAAAPKIYPIDEVPDLPLPNCDAEFCLCVYNVAKFEFEDEASKSKVDEHPPKLTAAEQSKMSFKERRAYQKADGTLLMRDARKVVSVLLGAILILAIARCNQPISPEEQAIRDREDLVSSAEAACRVFINRSLNDADSAEYGAGPTDRVAVEQEDGTWLVRRALKARNRFNALVPVVFICELKREDGNWNLLELKRVQ
jgi:hypothetical protein